LTGILGGLISSTSVAFSFSRLSRSNKGEAVPLALGVIGASTVLFARVTVATAALNPALAREALPYFVLPFLLGTATVALGVRRNNNKDGAAEPVQIENPLQFWASLQMGAVFQVVLFLVNIMSQRWGEQGLLATAAVLGLTDVDALTISMARGGHGAAWEVAAQALSIGILSNTLLKGAVSLALGSGRYRWVAAGGLAVIAAVLAASLLVFR
jgi:uncharacterized membrane protein (DUF4010 family)